MEANHYIVGSIHVYMLKLKIAVIILVQKKKVTVTYFDTHMTVDEVRGEK